jgi:CO/xanthine dehydrogenase Mo-binding subunit
VEAGFAAAELVFEDSFTLPIQHQGYIEPHACLVAVDRDGAARVWTSTKQPFVTQTWLAEALGLAPEQITVEAVSIGGDFGGKGYLTDEPLAYYLARATARPVRMVQTYAEELQAGVPRHAAVVSIRSGLTRDGRLVARHARLVFNGGAYAGNKPHPDANLFGAEAACGVYRIPNTLIESLCVYTNQVPGGHMRAPGWIQASFAVESHTDMLAARLNLDPLELRRINVIEPGDTAPTGDHWKNPRARQVLEQAASLAGWGGPNSGSNVGHGLSLTYEHIGNGKSGAIISVDENGLVTLLTGVPDVGTGAHTLFRQLVAEVLTIAPEDVAVTIGNTSTAPFDSGSGADRVTHVAGTTVHQAATKLKSELCSLAAEIMGWPEAEVRLEGGAFRPRSDGDGTPFRELAGRVARASGGRVEVTEILSIDGHAAERNFTAQVAEVEVDRDSGKVSVRRMVSVQDIGSVLNPRLAEGQVEGGAITGLGYAMMEELRIENGRVTTASLGDYRIPVVPDVPELNLAFLASNEGPAPYGSKAVGEVGLCGVAPAIANAVFDAVGVRITDLPITAEKVHRLLMQAEAQP